MTDRMTRETRVKCECAAILRRNHAEWTLQQIGDAMGVTKERARQYLSIAGERTKAMKPQRICVVCGKHIMSGRRRHCSRECQKRATIARWGTAVCDWCGAEIRRSMRELRPRPGNPKSVHFCNKTCQGKWLGAYHGRGMQLAKPSAKLDILVRV